MRLRILHVSPYADAAWAYGGIPRVVGALTEGLAARGHAVTVCTTDACSEESRLPGGHAQFRNGHADLDPLLVRRVFPNISNRLAYRHQVFLPVGLATYLRRHAGDFDVAHLHACRNLPGAIAAHYLNAAGVPYVLAPNGTAPRIERQRTAKRVFDALIGRRVLTDAACVLAVSRAERHQLSESGVLDAAIRDVPNPIDLQEFATEIPRGVCRARWGIGSGPVVLFLGRITPRKNVNVLVRAFARLPPEARLVIAGNDTTAGETRRLVEALGLAERTIFAGLLIGDQRLHALADADVVVYPSEHEVFGLVAFEALLAGTPVVVAGDSGCGELVSAVGGGRVVRVNDVDALADAIRAVLACPDEWRARTTRAAAAIRERFAAPVVCAALEHVYEEIVTGRREALSA